jgi:hypothetical protein
VPGVPGVFLQDVDQDPGQRGGRVAVGEPAAGSADGGQVGRGDDGLGLLARCAERGDESAAVSSGPTSVSTWKPSRR